MGHSKLRTPGSCFACFILISNSILVLRLDCEQLQKRSLSTRAKMSQQEQEQDLQQDPNRNRTRESRNRSSSVYICKAIILQTAAMFPVNPMQALENNGTLY
ncbi:uncharacterized protein LOC127011543 [Drosophila biarmipes]|uniref:uncharacterized protein LOC127011543 n=1 Tax=Drosophila biarmipes TaxID=125945 RepID=UPI0021CCC496|nr:uncharacterized protein LOC127011543 [Drosophila biarmipes]XP_050744728.1 uncharacterized protein LOC127011543 [Drosophila biarmipes]XP_050744729.1 uncharacterized protein LOC127011543 [Drosophila biarmipes]